MANLAKRNRAIAAQNVFSVDDGTEEYTLTDKFGRTICKLYLRGSDMSILDRVQELQDKIDDIVAPLSDIDIERDGSALTDETRDTIKAVEQRVIQAIDDVFDLEGGAEAIFKKRSPFACVNGRFFLENVLSALVGVVSRVMEREGELSMKRMDKYLSDLPRGDGEAHAGESADND